MRSLNALLMKELINGCERLSAPSNVSVSAYIKSRESASGGFVDKAGNVDVYYTFFGLASAFALGFYINKNHKRFLNGIDPSNLDLPHFAAYKGSLGLLKYFAVPKKVRMGFVKSALRLPFAAKMNPIVERFPLTPESSPYTVFLSVMGSAMSDDDQRLISMVEGYIDDFHIASGGWSNIKGNSNPSLNATAAAITLLSCGNISIADNDINWLKAQQLPTGGFLSVPGAPLPDLLSTATALVALKLSENKPLFPVMDFIQSHWREDGGFAAIFTDEQTDCEYTFYGLLALGASID